MSSFGFSGTNAHVLVEEAPAVAAPVAVAAEPARGRYQMLPLSARSPEALAQLTSRYRDWLDANPEADACGHVRHGGSGPLALRTSGGPGGGFTATGTTTTAGTARGAARTWAGAGSLR